MGWSYIPIPVGELPPDTAEWLQSEVGLEMPASVGISRKPTAAEVRATVEALSDYAVEAHQGCESLDLDLAHRSDPQKHTTIWIKDYHSLEDESMPVEFSFHKGDPETVVLVVERLARTCGPFVVIDTGGSFALVAEGTPAIVEWTE